MYVENCTGAVDSPLYVDASRCTTNTISSYFYFLDRETPPREFNENCTTIAEDIPVMIKSITGVSTLDIYQNLSMGFDLYWEDESFYCWKNKLSIASIFRTILAEIRYALSAYVATFLHHLMHGPQVYVESNEHPGNGKCYLCLEITGKF